MSEKVVVYLEIVKIDHRNPARERFVCKTLFVVAAIKSSAKHVDIGFSEILVGRFRSAVVVGKIDHNVVETFNHFYHAWLAVDLAIIGENLKCPLTSFFDLTELPFFSQGEITYADGASLISAP